MGGTSRSGQNDMHVNSHLQQQLVAGAWDHLHTHGFPSLIAPFFASNLVVVVALALLVFLVCWQLFGCSCNFGGGGGWWEGYGRGKEGGWGGAEVSE